MTDETEPLMINGKQVDRKLLETRLTQRCQISECQSWCCTGGVWVDLWEKEKILANAEVIKPNLPSQRRDERQWFDGEQQHDADYPSDWGEGTQVVNDPNAQHPWSLKPFYSVLHPITIEDNLVQLDDTNVVYIQGGHCQGASAE